MHLRYLLVLACSQRKRPSPGLLKAIERYDGVNFRVLKKAQRLVQCSSELDVLILSARYGLIPCDTLIEDYDVKMSAQRASYLQRDASTRLDSYLSNHEYARVFINVGDLYLQAFAESQQLGLSPAEIQFATGGIGQRMAQMKAWLHSTAEPS